MRRPWIGLVVVVLLIAGAIGAAWYWGDGDWGPRNHTHHTEIARIVNADGSTATNGDIVVVETNRGGPFFPFFFPFGFLFFFAIIFLISRLFFWGRGGRSWNRPGPGGSPPARFDEWHRQAHERDWEASPRRSDDASSGTSGAEQS